MSDVMKGAGYGTLLTELKIRISRWLTTTKWLVMREGAADVAIHRFVIAMTNDLAACCLITNHLATVLWLLSGMASCSISQMASSSIRSAATRHPHLAVVARRQSRRGNPDALINDAFGRKFSRPF